MSSGYTASMGIASDTGASGDNRLWWWRGALAALLVATPERGIDKDMTVKNTDRYGASPLEGDAPEIEVTPAMIEAGVNALYESGAIENRLAAADRDLVARVYFEMVRVASHL